MGKVIPLTPPRAREADRRQPLIIRPVRADLPDYGPPGSHLTGPWAKTRSYIPRLFGLPDSEGDGEGSIAESCLAGLEGGVLHFNHTFDPAANEFHGQSSRVIPRGFVITDLGYQSTVARNVNIVFTVEVAENNDTTTISGNVFPRLSIFGRFSVGQNIFPTTTWQWHTMNYRETQAGRFIKMWLFNNSGAAVTVDLNVSLVLLS